MDVVGWEQARVTQTATSTVLLGHDRVLKVRTESSPDPSDLDAHLRSCEAEADRHRRTAPGLTLGIRRITRSDRGLEIDGSGPLATYAVEMWRLPEDRSLDRLVAAGDLGLDGIDIVAQWLAGFHDACATRESPAVLVDPVEEDSLAYSPEANALLGPNRAESTRAFLRRRFAEAPLSDRHQSGRIRDGHGELRLEYVYLLEDGPDGRVVALGGHGREERWIDVGSDLAGLLVSLAVADRSDLAERLLAQWALHTQDWPVYEVIDLYIAARAWGLGRTLARSDQADAARRHFELAHAVSQRSDPPVVVAVGGPIGSGKSTVASALSFALQGALLDADRTRAQLAGGSLETGVGTVAFSGEYSEAATATVYKELSDRALPVLASGRSVVLDAPFTTPALRSYARRLASRASVPCRFVATTAPRGVLRDRLARRAEAPLDAGADPLDTLLRGYSAPSGADVMTVDTQRPLDMDGIVSFALLGRGL